MLAADPSDDRVLHSQCLLRKALVESKISGKNIFNMKPAIVADEMFPEGAGPYMDIEEAGGSSALLMDLAANEKSVHADFYNDFEDLFDDEDLN